MFDSNTNNINIIVHNYSQVKMKMYQKLNIKNHQNMLKTIWNGINKVYVRHNHANRNKSSVMTILAFTFFNPKL